jgi:hypothetical protein
MAWRRGAPACRDGQTVSWPRVFASVVASAIGLAFWWALTEPLPVPPVILLGVAGAILFCAGIIAGNGGAIAAPVAFLFSLFVGSIIATQLHQAFRPQTAPVDEFNGLISLHFPEVLAPLAVAVAVGAVGGWVGERLVPARRWEGRPRR